VKIPADKAWIKSWKNEFAYHRDRKDIAGYYTASDTETTITVYEFQLCRKFSEFTSIIIIIIIFNISSAKLKGTRSLPSRSIGPLKFETLPGPWHRERKTPCTSGAQDES
jgi:hypothetical protein